MRYIFFFILAWANCANAKPINNRTQDALAFKIESDDDYDVVSVFSNEKLIADITEVSVKNPIIYPYRNKNSSIIITDIISEYGYYKFAQYVKISSKNGNINYIYNCKADFYIKNKVILNANRDGNYLRNLFWDNKLRMIKVNNEICKIANPVNPGGITF